MTLVTIGVIILIALAGTMAACGDGGTDTTASTSSSVSAGPTTESTAAADAGGTATASEERVVAGGEDAEEYTVQLPELQKALEADPDNLETLQQLAIAQYNTSAYEEAAATYEKMLALEDSGSSPATTTPTCFATGARPTTPSQTMRPPSPWTRPW